MKKTLLCIIFLINSVLCYGGAWTQKQGSGFYKFEIRYLSAGEIFGPDERKIPIPNLQEYSLNFYGEYGLLNWLTVSAYFPALKNLQSQDTTLGNGSLRGIGDIITGLRFQLIKGTSAVLSGGLELEIPGGSFKKGELSAGSGDFSQSILIQAGYSFYPVAAYVNAGLKYRNRNSGYSDDIYFGLEGGYSFTETILLIFRIKRLQSLNNGDGSGRASYGSIYSDKQQYLAYGPELIYKINPELGITLSFESGTAARNIISSPVLSAGIYYSR